MPSLETLPYYPTPDWLKALQPHNILNDRFPVETVLINSFFYPSSGIEGNPVKNLGGNFHSFVYVDYGIHDFEVIKALKRPGYSGYSLVAYRSITNKAELDPPQILRPEILPGDCERNMSPPTIFPRNVQPFALWCVFERKTNRPPEYGPERFSYLHIAGEAVATFMTIYRSRNITPAGMAIIAPGTGWGLNWTDFRNENKIMGRCVLNNPAGIPKILVTDGPLWQEPLRPMWPKYNQLVGFIDQNGWNHPVWKHHSFENDFLEEF